MPFCMPFCNCESDQTNCGGTACGTHSPTTLLVTAADSSPPLFDPKDFVDFHWDPGEDDQPRRRQIAPAPSQRLPWREYARVRH